MSDKIWNKAATTIVAAGQFPIPITDTVIMLLKTIMTEEQADFIKIFIKPLNIDEISEETGKDKKYLEKMLNELMSNGIITGIPAKSTGKIIYRLLPPVPGIFEFSLMRGEWGEKQKKIAKIFDDMFKEMADLVQNNYDNVLPAFKMIPAIDRVIPVENQINDADKELVLPAEEVRKIIDKFDDIAVSVCYCRHEKDLLGEHCETTKVRENCLSFGPAAKFIIDYKFGRRINKDEARKILRNSEDEGLVHKSFHVKLDPEREQEAICSCCKCCCGTFQLFYKGVTPMHSVTSYIARMVKENCTGCGICVDICPMNAITINDDVAQIEDERCIGCGLCSHHCSSDAIRLERTGKRDVFVAPPRLKK